MTITAAEQLLIELINRARLDPLGETARYGLGDVNQNLAAGTIKGTPMAVLAPNAALEAAADGHSQWMLDTDVFSHTGAGGSSPTTRMTAAGYTLSGSWRTGENIAWSGSTGQINLNTLISDHHRALFLSAPHRQNLLNPDFREIGVAQIGGPFASGGTVYNASMLTENFALSGRSVFLTGVAYTDLDNNDFYSLGEAGTATVFTIGASQTTTAAAGGYALGLTAAADVAVSITQGALSAQVRVNLSAGNGKLDLVDGKVLETSVDLTLVSGVTAARALGVSNVALTGGDGNDLLTGNSGANLLTGGAGADTLIGGLGNDTLVGGAGADVLNGGDGIDTVSYRGTLGAHLIDLAYAQFNTATAAGDSYVSIENLIGADGADDLRGTEGDNLLQGGGEADILHGRGGNDTLMGEAGDDVLVGGAGADRLIGGAGRDRAAYYFSTDNLTIDMASVGRNTFEAAGDTYGGIEDLAGGAGNDALFGDKNGNRIYGADGADKLYGRQGNDYLDGGAQNDRLDGGAGNDTLNGGLGADVFVFNGGRDVIGDFSFAQADRIGVERGALGGAALNGAQLAGLASVVEGHVVFDFGGGNTLTLQGLSSLDGLAASLFSF